MKTSRTVIGIISIVLFIIIIFQSCAVGLGNALSENGDISGSAGLLLSFFMLIAGIIGLATRKSKGGAITSGCFYLLGGLIGYANVGNFSDLKLWSLLSIFFGTVFMITAFKQKGKLD